MSGAWAAQLAASAWRAAAELRLRADVSACHVDDAVWLRGDHLSDELDLALRKLGSRRYAVSARGELTLPGERTPCGMIPSATWVPLSTFTVPLAQPAALPGAKPAPVKLMLVHGGIAREANVLRTTLGAWTQYAAGAPVVRLRRLSFAARAEGEVIVRGSPLPPLSGERFVEEHGAATPCGLQWQPRVTAKVVAARLGLSPGDLALFSVLKPSPAPGLAGAGRAGCAAVCEVIAASSFVAASRSAARLTLQGVRP